MTRNTEQVLSRRRVLGAGLPALLGLSSGCIHGSDPTAEMEDCDGMTIEETSYSTFGLTPDLSLTISVSAETHPDALVLVGPHGDQIGFDRMATGESSADLTAYQPSEGRYRMLAVRGGDTDSGEYVGGEIVAECAFEVVR